MTKVKDSGESIPKYGPSSDIFEQEKQQGYYDEALEALKDIPYAIRFRGAFNLSCFYANAYHILSVLLGLATAWLVTASLTGLVDEVTLINVIMGVLFGVLMLLVLGAVEGLKMILSKSVFKKAATKKKVLFNEKISLIGLMLVSIGISALGGAFLTVKVKDQSEPLKIALIVERDSLTNAVNAQIHALDSTKHAYFEQNNWGGRLDGSSRPQFIAYEEEIKKLREDLPKQIDKLEKGYKGRMAASATNANGWAWVAAVIVLLLEVLTLIAYWFKYSYFRKAKIEVQHSTANSTQQHGKTANNGNTPPVWANSVVGAVPLQPTQIGFGLPQNNGKNGYKITCENCGKTAVKNAHNARFCSNACRYEFHKNKVV